MYHDLVSGNDPCPWCKELYIMMLYPLLFARVHATNRCVEARLCRSSIRAEKSLGWHSGAGHHLPAAVFCSPGRKWRETANSSPWLWRGAGNSWRVAVTCSNTRSWYFPGMEAPAPCTTAPYAGLVSQLSGLHSWLLLTSELSIPFSLIWSCKTGHGRRTSAQTCYSLNSVFICIICMHELRIEMTDNQQLSRHKIKTFSLKYYHKSHKYRPALHTTVAFRFRVIQVQSWKQNSIRCKCLTDLFAGIMYLQR